MTTDSTVSDKTTCGSICKTLWPFIYIVIQLITYVGAAVQVAFCFMFLLIIIIAAICVSYKVHSVTGFLDDFTGLGIGSQINRDVDIHLFLIVLVFVLLASGPLYMSVILWKGLEKNKEEYIWSYIIGGILLLVVRVWAIDSYEYDNFPEDKTVLYCGLYALYLVLLVITCFEIRIRCRQAELAEIATASSRIRTFFTAMRSSDGTTIMYGRV